MARLNLYEQQTALNTPRADASAFGGNTAGAVAQAGGAAFDLGMAIKRREDVIDRVQRLNEFDTYAQEALTAANDTEDIAKQSTVDALSQGLRQRASEIMNQHGGTAASKAELRAQVENQVGQYIKSAKAAQVKAQQQFIGRAVDQRVNELAIKGSFDPALMPQLFEQFDSDLAVYADAMSPEQAAAYKEAGRSAIATGTIDKMLQDGNWQGAKALLQSPEVNRFLDRNAARRFAIDTTVEERKAEVEVKRQNDNVRRITQIARRDLSPAEVERARMLPPKKDMTVSDKITEYELVTGKPASQSVIDEMFNVDNGGVGGGIFGNSLQGRALNFVTENAAAYAAGLLSPEKRMQFEAMSAEAYKPVQRINPITQQMETIQPNIPQFVQEAMAQGRGRGAQVGPTGPQPGQTVQLTGPDGRVIGSAVVGPNGQWTITDSNPQMGWGGDTGTGAPAGGTTPNLQGIPLTPPSPGQGGRTVWERRKNIAGPVAGITSAVNSVPGIGPIVAGAVMGEAEVRQAEADRTFVENASRDLIRTLANNSRFPVAEMQSLEKEIGIGPEFFKSDAAYEGKLIGVAESLTKRKMDAQRTLASNISGDARKFAMDNIAAIDNFMINMGLPPVITNEADELALPPGTKFMDAKGNPYTRR